MQVLPLKDALKSKREHIIEEIRKGKLFIYPTDTVYGIGCNAEIAESVKRIAEAKGRDKDKPMSVIAPSKDWIAQNAKATPENMAFASTLLPGPYTVIMKAKPCAPKPAVAKEGTIAMRIPADEFTKIVMESGVPFITTSANLSGSKIINEISELPEEIKSTVDYAIDAGRIDGHSSRIFDLTKKEIKILRY